MAKTRGSIGTPLRQPSTGGQSKERRADGWAGAGNKWSDEERDYEIRVGWRIYVTKVRIEQLFLAQTVVYYRDQWQLEHGFHRFKRGQLPALPIYLANEDRIIGLMFLLTIALRCFTLIEFQVRRQLQAQQDEIAGLYAGNPKRKTQRPTAEQLLAAFDGITLYHHRDGTSEITPLNDLQRRILALMKLPETIYALPVPTRFIPDSAQKWAKDKSDI